MAAFTTINDPEAHYQTQLYTGNGAANNAITLGGTTDMQPDLVWIKNRDAADSHCVFDAVRGATKVIHPNATTAEATDADTLDSFTSDGFQVDADVKVNTNAEKYVAWCWKANGTGSSNTDGTINTGATSANTTSGFSINTYTGTATNATVGHGLGVVPQMIIVKNRSDGEGWIVYHSENTSAPETDILRLDRDLATADNAVWNDTAPTSSVFSIGTDSKTNANTHEYIAYAWTPVQGFSKFGNYTGNGNADGPFVYTGFRPAWLLRKRTDSAQQWQIYDNKRDGYNGSMSELYTDGTDSDGTSNGVDFLSNGFKVTVSNGGMNTSGGTHIYIAFAEAPFVNSNGVPNNAR